MMAIRICNVSDIKPGRALRIKIGDHAFAIVHTPEGKFHALDDKCSHGEISLSEGFVDNETIECWAHGAKFSLTTGSPLSLPAYEPVSVYEVLVENDELFLEYEA
ncbi:MAG: non-heme iron oxygenase ferredoxin subunit [Micrococcales bacterium]|nr:non-heme iron oxygenase ferredoxin subunit [Micrococcales bacterium]NBR60364.1 non-heme iron oxygenase ferredoxin subunit [Actinomycetota bacterium]NBT46299.1 non-heme iron oxygenase ferredoxin subunit [Actinomycetota bacterium]NBY44315.1 non-heme iron oxygenase ferredoxin subunit [Micrococcales bacterium]NDE88752.1 non-heme iron oxygenase ferredoxin subunit [Micrococcales bacterium]